MAWAYTKGRESSQDKLVCGCILCCTPQHAKPHMSGVDFGMRSSLWLIHKTEVEHKKRNRSRTGCVNDVLPQVL